MTQTPLFDELLKTGACGVCTQETDKISEIGTCSICTQETGKITESASFFGLD